MGISISFAEMRFPCQGVGYHIAFKVRPGNFYYQTSFAHGFLIKIMFTHFCRKDGVFSISKMSD